jgi:hypothetical protein
MTTVPCPIVLVAPHIPCSAPICSVVFHAQPSPRAYALTFPVTTSTIHTLETNLHNEYIVNRTICLFYITSFLSSICEKKTSVYAPSKCDAFHVVLIAVPPVRTAVSQNWAKTPPFGAAWAVVAPVLLAFSPNDAQIRSTHRCDHAMFADLPPTSHSKLVQTGPRWDWFGPVWIAFYS